jgi:metallo-beta-lactamase family protein
MNITFLGAAQPCEVTGSCYLAETADTRFLVDCGMVQGRRARHRRATASRSHSTRNPSISCC